MKKKAIYLFFILFLTAGFRIADCYSAWTYMYDAATDEYNSNMTFEALEAGRERLLLG